ncbi:hypothetical protein [Solicola sp. PLA-1-18]|uniref:hypothetical protein n=1 Tax=Solicola sp. PLA-1-18 TaxID=3380532 RepID=UPI003B7E5BEC
MLIAVDFDPDGLVIVPCRLCPQVWWAEVVLVGRRVQLREWHRAECPDWGDVVAYVTPPALAPTAQDVVVRGAGLRGLQTVPTDRGDHR